MIIRPMVQADVPVVMAIDEIVCEFPWTIGIFSDCIKVGYDCWVIEDNEEIIGYGIVAINSGEGHILNLSIIPQRQRQGLGTRLMKHLILQAKDQHARSVYLEVRVSNTGAYDLYQKMGFAVIGHRKDYYPHQKGREDAIVLELIL